jgi:hypothetical protein
VQPAIENQQERISGRRKKWLKNLSPGSSASFATGEHTVPLTWLEFPDCNIHTK